MSRDGNPRPMDVPERLDPRDPWVALATDSFTRELSPDERDKLDALARSIDPMRAGAMNARLERLRRQLDAPRPNALHHQHPVALEGEPNAEGLVACDLLACWFPRQ